MPLRSALFLFSLSFLISVNNLSGIGDNNSVRMNSRLSFYSNEKYGEMIIHFPADLYQSNLDITLTINNTEAVKWKGVPGARQLSIPFPIDLPAGKYTVTAEIKTASGKRYNPGSTIDILDYKPNEVKTDFLTGGLLVRGRVFFPFGFYCYSPVDPILPEEEFVKGFNMISPYQKILPETYEERKAYMDRCAEIGMKVHYNLLSVSGGGGVSSKIEGISEIEKRERLISEIKAFMDHPALLAWYISDEPNGYKIPPEQLEEIYTAVKKTDPWHPVSVVFMAPFISARKYSDALDIVMADPYPIPNGSVSQTGDVIKLLRNEFEGRKAVWLVPQAFGGGEWWDREPTIGEIRNMTYQGIVNGAKGIQYFVRHGPNSFPKSTSAWNECGQIALEVAEMTPWLLSDEKAIPVHSLSGNISVLSAVYKGKLLIIAVNKVNTPQKAEISIAGKTETKVRVLFENRIINISSGLVTDQLPAFGTQVYLTDIVNPHDTVTPYRDNMIKDPGFEDLSSPGIPSACYAWNEGDRGSTYFTDTREHYEGTHSLRMITPKYNQGTRLRFFPVKVEKGRTYMISVRAMTDSLSTEETAKPFFDLGMGTFRSESFYPDHNWKEYVTFVTIPADSIPSDRVNTVLRVPGKGVIWFDMLQVIKTVDINKSLDPAVRDIFMKKY